LLILLSLLLSQEELLSRYPNSSEIRRPLSLLKAQNQNDGQLSPTPAAEGEAQYASAKPYFEERNIQSKRSSRSEDTVFPEEKKKRNSYCISLDEFRKSFVDVKDLRRPINYSHIATLFIHVVLVSSKKERRRSREKA